MKAKFSSGFTLMELMIVVAIVGILAAVAIPSYTSSITKGRRAEARAALADLLQQQERYFTQRNTYAAFAAGATGTAFKTFSANTSAKSDYMLGAQTCPAGATATPTIADCVQVFAVPVARIKDDEAKTLTMTTTGVKSCDGTNPSVCWK